MSSRLRRSRSMLKPRIKTVSLINTTVKWKGFSQIKQDIGLYFSAAAFLYATAHPLLRLLYFKN